MLEAALIIAATLALHAGLRAVGVPLSLSAMATLLMLIPCTWLLHRRGLGWGDLGFRRITHWCRTILWALGLFVMLMLIPPLLTAPLATLLALPPQHLAALGNLRGNLPLYLLTLIADGWGAAAFGEELLFRGFIFRRLMDAFGSAWPGVIGALVLQAAVFAVGHLHLGPIGMLNAGFVALICAATYLANGRDLWPLIVAHGLVDTVGLTTLFLGAGHG